MSRSTPKKVEPGLRSLERLIERGDIERAKFAAEFIETSHVPSMDEGQLQRWRSAQHTLSTNPSEDDHQDARAPLGVFIH